MQETSVVHWWIYSVVSSWSFLYNYLSFYWNQNVYEVILGRIAENFVAVIVKVIIHVTMLLECVLVDVRMGIWSYIVTAVRKRHRYSYMSYCICNCLCFINCTFLWIIACEIGKYGKNCSSSCFQDCNGNCSHIDGSCDCIKSLKSHCPKGNN